MKYFNINISYLPSVFPNKEAIDRIELPISQRPIFIGSHVTRYITEDKHSTIDTEHPKQVEIRNVSWDKYKCSIIVHEGQNFTELNLAKEVIIELPNNYPHHVNMIEFGEPIPITGTNHMQIDFVYYDSNQQNYTNIPINDFAISDSLPDYYEESELNYLTVDDVKYYTVINATHGEPNIKQTEDEINGLIKVIKTIHQDILKCTVFVTNDQANTIQKKTSQINEYSFGFYTAGGTQINAIERALPTVTKIDYDLYRVDINIKYTNNVTNHY